MTDNEQKTDVWQGLMDSAYDRWKDQNWSYEQFLDQCNQKERKAVLLGNMNAQVENGGFQQWVDNGYVLHGEEVLDVLEEINEKEKSPTLDRLIGSIEDLLHYVDLKQKNRGFSGNYWKKPVCQECGHVCGCEEDGEGGRFASSLDDWYYKEVEPVLVPAVEKFLS